MKYVLLALGIVLIIGGAMSMYWGYGIIEDERGWATFLAGATALTGGVIVIALAFVFGALERLRVGLETRMVLALPAKPDLSAPPPLPLAREEAPAPQREEPAFGATDRAVPARSAERSPEPPHTAPAAPVMPEPPQPATAGLSRASSAFIAAAAKAREQQTDPSITDLWRRVGVNLETMKSDKIAPAPQAGDRQEPRLTAGPDWLDEALAGFGESVAPQSPEANEDAPPLAPNAPPEQPEVIGRYKVEGTEYLMYADGSIDAQTEEGVLRFKSLGELKAFFQG
ncbi:MAG: hypothetical protein WA831_05955 [Methylovirgula sp.]